jgi:hypothetical protein
MVKLTRKKEADAEAQKGKELVNNEGNVDNFAFLNKRAICYPHFILWIELWIKWIILWILS